LAAAFEQAPLHLGDEASKAGGRRVDEMKLVFDITLYSVRKCHRYKLAGAHLFYLSSKLGK
jgi:hypothetical protein